MITRGLDQEKIKLMFTNPIDLKDAIYTNELKYKSLVDNLPVAVYSTDANGLISYFNKEAAVLWGREPKLNDPEELLFCGSWKIFTLDGDILPHDQCPMAKALKTHKSFRKKEIAIEKPNGKKMAALANIDPIFDENGKLIGAINILIDITERKKLEKKLKRSNKKLKIINSKKDEFLSLVSHELKTPLSCAFALIQLMEYDLQSPYSSEIKKHLKHLDSTISDLLNLSKIEKGQLSFNFQAINLKEILEESIEVQEKISSTHKVNFEINDDYVIFGDRNRLYQVFNNIISNAIKYSPKAVEIDIKAKRISDYVNISIRDYGIGIPKECNKNIFSKYYRVNGDNDSISGLGIGLYLAKMIIAQHKGKIKIMEPEGPGTIFNITLPVHD